MYFCSINYDEIYREPTTDSQQLLQSSPEMEYEFLRKLLNVK